MRVEPQLVPHRSRKAAPRGHTLHRLYRPQPSSGGRDALGQTLLSSRILWAEAALVAPERMSVGYLHDDDPYAVRIRDPHLHQPPGLAPRLAQDRDSSVSQPVVLGVDVSDLEPQRDRISGWVGGLTADLEKTVAREEDQAGRVGAAELSVDGQAQQVTIEAVAAGEVGGTQENSAAEYLHAAILPRRSLMFGSTRGTPQQRKGAVGHLSAA